VALAVVEGQAMAGESLAAGDGQARGGIQSSGQEDDGGWVHGARIYPNKAVDRAGICLFLRYNLPLSSFRRE
jgi:hypothetical protein